MAFQKERYEASKKQNDSKSTYEVIMELEGVLVKVPSEGCLHFDQVRPHTIKIDGVEIAIPVYYRHGFLVQTEPRIILNKNYYGIDSADLGRMIVATVKVIKKTTGKGRVFTMIDITKAQNGVEPNYELRILDKKHDESDILIIETEKFIHFKPIVRA
jgi:hypothetical protein